MNKMMHEQDKVKIHAHTHRGMPCFSPGICDCCFLERKGISPKCLTEPCSPLAKAKQHLTSDEISEKELRSGAKGEVFCDIVKAFSNCSVWGQIA